MESDLKNNPTSPFPKEPAPDLWPTLKGLDPGEINGD
jgi:hypothetical protein